LPVGNLTTARFAHTATLLQDGQVLIAGGYVCCSAPPYATKTAELYDPRTRTFTPTGSMNEARAGQTATLLPNGKVLVIGGTNTDILASAELYDPSTGNWVETGPMSIPREEHTATLLANGEVLVAGGYSCCDSYGSVNPVSSTELYDPGTGLWTPTGSLLQARGHHSAVRLNSGRVLVAGGEVYGAPLTQAELYDPGSGTWTATGPLSVPRVGASSVLLADGTVLVAGGDVSGTVDLYNPQSGTFALTGSMSTPREGQSATLLPDGEVLVAGGAIQQVNGQSVAQASAEVYVPRSGVWATTASMTTARTEQTATLLADGRVLVVGGADSNRTPLPFAELYIPGGGPRVHLSATNLSYASQVVGTASVAQTITLTNPSTATLTVRSVTVMGPNPTDFSLSQNCTTAPVAPSGTCTISVTFAPTATGNRTASLIIVDDAPGSPQTVALAGPALSPAGPLTWSVTGSMATARYGHTATLLPNGTVLVAGGEESHGTVYSSAELYNPATGTWAPTGSMAVARVFALAVLLQSGRVLVAGGDNAGSAELYNPATGAWAPTGNMHTGHAGGTITLLPSGKVLVAGGNDATAEVYDPATGTWTETTPISVARANQTATLLPNGTVLVAGGGDQGTIQASAEIYNPTTGFWTATGSMTVARQLQTASLLRNGTVLVAGGLSTSACCLTPPLASAEIYDPTTGRWTATGSMTAGQYRATATLLMDGRVLAVNDAGPFSAELYDPATGVWLPGRMLTARQYHTATLLATGQVLVAGGTGEDGATLGSAELYTPHAPAQLAVTPGTAYVGQKVGLSGAHFAAAEPVTFALDGITLPLTTTSGLTGTLVATLTVPQATFGPHLLSAVGLSSTLVATTTLQIRPALALDAYSGKSGSTDTAVGTGFGASEPVVLHWNTATGPTLGTTTSSSTGSFYGATKVTFRVPAGYRGWHRLYGVGMRSGAVAATVFYEQ
jgi:WD40 repeat protein